MPWEESLRELEAGQMPERYRRNQGTVGTAGQLRLLRAKVAVVGAGGLGGHVIELLARQGVGHLLIIDGDNFACHNLNRQVLATARTLGMNKARAAADRVAVVNSDVEVEAIPQMLDETKATEWLAGMDVVVDALDTLSARRMLLAVAQNLRIPLVHAAIAGFTGQVATIWPDDLANSALFASRTDCDRGVETVLGNPAATPAIAAALQAQEVVKIITGVGQPLRGKILYFDLEYNLFETIQMK